MGCETKQHKDALGFRTTHPGNKKLVFCVGTMQVTRFSVILRIGLFVIQ